MATYRPLQFACLLALLGGALAARERQDSFLKRSSQQDRMQSKTMDSMYPFYHTTEKIQSELEALASRCKGMTLESVPGSENTNIQVVTIKDPESTPVNKNFLLFGEHARELISPESGFHLVKSLCGETDLSAQAAAALKDSEFQIVVNGNPGSRKKVEQGDFCLRVNPDGVDLNRNWDEEWLPDPVLDASDTNPGPKAFSEPETIAFKDMVTKYQPTTFLTIHSGTRGMYMPWAYDMEHLATRNQPQMLQILKDLDKDHCECPFGAAGREVGYSCPGTCLDWVYDKLQAQYAFAFEIYTGTDFSDDLKSRWQEKMQQSGASFLQEHSHLAHEHFHSLFEEHPTDFVQLSSKHRSRGPGGMSADDCMGQFNPTSEDDFKSVVENWSAAYLDMAKMVASNLKNGVNSTSSL